MSDYIEKLKESVASLVAPIPGGTPVGIDSSYDPDFEQIKAEIDKLVSVSSGAPDWREVTSLGDRLLKEKTKDFRLLVWCALARLRTSGIHGGAEGVMALKLTCEAYWDEMYPPARRARARGNLADWMNEQITAELQPWEPTANDADALKALQSVLDEVDAVLADKLASAYGGLGSLRSLLRDKVRQLPAAPAPTPAAAPAATPVATVDSVPTNATAATTNTSSSAASTVVSAPEAPTISGTSDILPALRTLGKNVVEVVRHMRRADPANSVSYRLQRTGIWLAIGDAPPAEGTKTRLPPPPADVKKKFEMRVQAAQWLELLTAAEDLTSTYLFWLDLHRLVALAMDRLGALFVDARLVLSREVVAFVDRVPTVVKLTFADGTPFADVATQTWLDEERSKHGSGGGSSPASSTVSEEEEELKRRFEEAREMVTSGNVAEGLSLATQLAVRGADSRTRFRARLAVAQLALQGGEFQIGKPMLEALVAEAETRHLDDWEPQLAAAVYSAALVCERSTAGKTERPEIRRVFERLCQIDPALALKAVR